MSTAKTTIAILISILFTICASAQISSSTACEAADPARAGEARHQWAEVSGSGVHFFTTAILHSSEPTPTGKIDRSTETVELNGDLMGRILYHPVSVFDFTQGTLVNTGNQVFSGTVLGSDPVLLHDDEFRFEVDLTSGATVGEVHLVDRIDGPRIRCHLEVMGTGLTESGDATFDYFGKCRVPRLRPMEP